MSHRRNGLFLLVVSVATFTLFAAFEYGARVAGLLLLAYFIVGMFAVGYVIGVWLTRTAVRVAGIRERVDGERVDR